MTTDLITTNGSTGYSEPDGWDRVPLAEVRPLNRWNLGPKGDLRTWAVLFFIFFFTLALALIPYALPHGRDAIQPQIHIY